MAFPGGVDVEFTSRTDNFLNGVRTVKGELKSLDRDARAIDLSSRATQGASSLQTYSKAANQASVDTKGLTLSMVGLGTTMIGIFAASSRLDFAQNRLQKTQVAVRRIQDQIASTQKNLNRLMDQGKTNTEDYNVQLSRLETAYADLKTKQEDVVLAQTALNDTQLLFATTVVNTAINSIFLMRSAFSGLSLAQIKATITTKLFSISTLASRAPIGAMKGGIMGLTLQTRIFGVALKTALPPLIAITAGFAAWEGLIAPFIKEQAGVNLSVLDWTDSMLAGKVALDEVNEDLKKYQDAAGQAADATGDITSEMDRLFGLIGKPSSNPMVEFWRRARIEALVPYLDTLKSINTEQAKAGLASGVIPSLGGGSASVSGGIAVTGSGTPSAIGATSTQAAVQGSVMQQAQQESLTQALSNSTPTTQRALVQAVEQGMKTTAGPLSQTAVNARRIGLMLGVWDSQVLNSSGVSFDQGTMGTAATVTGTSSLTDARKAQLFREAAINPRIAGLLGLPAIGGKNQNYITGQQIAGGFTFGDDEFTGFDNSARAIRRRAKDSRINGGQDNLFRGSTGGNLLATDFSQQFGATGLSRFRSLRDLDPVTRLIMALAPTIGRSSGGFGSSLFLSRSSAVLRSMSLSAQQDSVGQMIGIGGRADAAIAAVGGNANSLIGGAIRFAGRNRQALQNRAQELSARDTFVNSLQGARAFQAGSVLQGAIRAVLGFTTGKFQPFGNSFMLSKSAGLAIEEHGGLSATLTENASFAILSGLVKPEEINELRDVAGLRGNIGVVTALARITRDWEASHRPSDEIRDAAKSFLTEQGPFELTKFRHMGVKKFDRRASVRNTQRRVGRLREFFTRANQGRPITTEEADVFVNQFLSTTREAQVLATLNTSVHAEFMKDNVDTRREVLELEGRAWFIEREERASLV